MTAATSPAADPCKLRSAELSAAPTDDFAKGCGCSGEVGCTFPTSVQAIHADLVQNVPPGRGGVDLAWLAPPGGEAPTSR